MPKSEAVPEQHGCSSRRQSERRVCHPDVYVIVAYLTSAACPHGHTLRRVIHTRFVGGMTHDANFIHRRHDPFNHTACENTDDKAAELARRSTSPFRPTCAAIECEFSPREPRFISHSGHARRRAATQKRTNALSARNNRLKETAPH